MKKLILLGVAGATAWAVAWWRRPWIDLGNIES
jgi:hypothetical protein